MIHSLRQTDSNRFQQKFIDNSILLGSLIGLAAFIVAATTSERSSDNLNYYSDPISFIVLGGLYLLRNRISSKSKSIAMIIVILTFVISDSLYWGFYSLNTVLIVLIPFYAVLVFRTRIAITIYFGAVLLYMFTGYLNHHSVIANADLLLFRVTSIPVWIESGLLLSCASLIVIVFTREYTKALGSAVEDLKDRNRDLVDREKNLEERNERLAEYAFVNSHVIRAPLARLLSLTDMVSEEVTIDKHREFLGYIKSSADELDQIVRKINDILNTKEGFDREQLIALLKSQE